MKAASWKAIAELIGIGAIVASLVFLALQIKQSQDIARFERDYSSLGGRIDQNLSIIANGEVWAKGNSGQKLDETEYAVFSKMVENQHWAAWSGWRSARRLDLPTSEQISTADFAAYLHANPGALNAWREYIGKRESARQALVDQYQDNDFVTVVEAEVAELERRAE